MLYADKNILDTLSSRDSIYLKVGTFEIDSTSQSIYDVKDLHNLPFRLGEDPHLPHLGRRGAAAPCSRNLGARAVAPQPRQTNR